MQRNKLSRVLTALLCEPWLISPQTHAVLVEIVQAHAFGGVEESAQHAKALSFAQFDEEKETSVEVVGNTAIIKADGVFARKSANIINSSGITSTDIFQQAVEAAGADPRIKSILLMIDSPGGYSMGIPEAASAVARVKEDKPVFAYVDGQANSAAYWIASQCDAVYCMPSGNCGCIGAYIAMLDRSIQFRMNGMETKLFASGKYKGMGMPGLPLTKDQEALLQKEVTDISNEFKAAVLSGRGIPIADEHMQGQSFSAKDAVSIGLIDKIADVAEALRDVAAAEKITRMEKRR
jgi:signal peptide peptidase SppA